MFGEEFLPGSGQNPEACGVYPKSVHAAANGDVVFMAREESRDVLIAKETTGFTGERFINPEGDRCVRAPLNHENAVLLRRLFPFTSPRPVLGEPRTFGVGDRLGIASPGHIRALRRYDALPVLAQQSIRELNLTNRTYDDVIDSAAFAVFREGWNRGFGADGDHLKTPDEVKYALSCGCTMITLDCGERIRDGAADMTDAQVSAAYSPRSDWEGKYLNMRVPLGRDISLEFDGASFARTALIYGDAIEFACEIYDSLIKGAAGLDFEISIDETTTPTTPAQHYFVAKELLDRGVLFTSIAPSFCGEFQKGIDYVGDIDQFRREFSAHAAIAKQFGYKISVHSGSDKFAVFPIVGELTEGRFHVKTAGTSWLEAMRLVAMKDPDLYRRIHRFALSAFEDARRYYHVTGDPRGIPDVYKITDDELPKLFERSDSRQLIHITYGMILNEKTKDGSYVFKYHLSRLWRENDDAYFDLLDAHIGRHLKLLYGGLLQYSGRRLERG